MGHTAGVNKENNFQFQFRNRWVMPLCPSEKVLELVPEPNPELVPGQVPYPVPKPNSELVPEQVPFPVLGVVPLALVVPEQVPESVAESLVIPESSPDVTPELVPGQISEAAPGPGLKLVPLLA